MAGRKDTGKLNFPHKMKPVKSDPMQSAEHGRQNQARGLPKDLFGHMGQPYGGKGAAPCQDDNMADQD